MSLTGVTIPGADVARRKVVAALAITEIDGVSMKGRGFKPWAHARNGSCLVHQTFTCDRCGRRVGDCLGEADNMPGACDFCWNDGGVR